MKHIKLKEIINSLPSKKNSKSSLWVKLIIRKISFLFTYIFINIGVSAWMASMISVLVAVLGTVLLSIDNNTCRIIGVLLIQFWLVLDCVDGNIARVRKTSSTFGEFVDALSGYYVTGLVFIGIGIAAYYTTSLDFITPIFFIIIGAITSVAGILARIIHQKYTYAIIMSDKKDGYDIPEKEVDNKRSIQHIRNRVDKEIGISGLFMPFLIIACVFNLYNIMTIFYFIFQVVGLTAVTLYYSLKARQ